MVFSCDPDKNGNGQMKISFERNTLKVTWCETVTQINLSINPGVLLYKMKGNKYFHNTHTVKFSVNDSISVSSYDVNAETSLSSEKGHI